VGNIVQRGAKSRAVGSGKKTIEMDT